jgi:hypothetical protein
MHSVGRLAAAFIGCFILTLVWVTPAAIHADDWNLATRFMVNQPFEVPGLVLQPNTRYVIRLFDSPSERHVAEIYNGDETKMLTRFLGIADQRNDPVDKTVFTFIETDPGYPVPIKEWFYPGRLNGLEFVYPKSQAMEIAQHALEPIKAGDGDLHDLASATVEAIEPLRSGFAFDKTATAASLTKPETTVIEEEKKQDVTQEEQPVAVAQNNTQSNTQSEVSNTTKTETSSTTSTSEQSKAVQDNTVQNQTAENKQLPRTAGELPLIALIGLLCVGGGLGMKVLSSRS